MEPLAGGHCRDRCKSLWDLVRPTGLEPVTFGSGVIALHESLLFRLVEQHLEEFLRLYEERFAKVHGPGPEVTN